MAQATWKNVSGVWKQASNVWMNVGGVWKQGVKTWINIGGTWKECFGTPNITTTGSSTIPNGAANSSLSVTVTCSNSGSAGVDTILWKVVQVNSPYLEMQSGSFLTSFPVGTSYKIIPGVYYPAFVGAAYTFQYKAPNERIYRMSNQFYST